MIGELLFGGAFVLAGLLTVGFGDVRAVARGRRDPLLPVREVATEFSNESPDAFETEKSWTAVG
ncbi:hypothetical protein BRC65_08745 [Halobacteriales archaeon QH_2_65_14]|nr:MAG: hypothetical protein BRC65_08745 [Halobacteriales archaeon QH_2_65_14]